MQDKRRFRCGACPQPSVLPLKVYGHYVLVRRGHSPLLTFYIVPAARSPLLGSTVSVSRNPASTGFPSDLSSVLRGTSQRKQLLVQDSSLRLQTVAYRALLFFQNFGTIGGACVESHDEPLHEADGCENCVAKECNEGLNTMRSL